EIVGQQAIVDWHQRCCDLRHSVIGFEMRVRVRGDVSNAIALPDTHRLQGRGPAITPLEELGVRQPQLAVDYGFSVGVKSARATRKFNRRQRDFHWTVPSYIWSGNERPRFSGGC